MSLFRSRFAPIAGVALVAAIVPVSVHAAPPDAARKAECVAAFEEGQEQEKAGKVVEARRKFVACTAEDCPGVVRDECAKLLANVEASTPTIVPALRDARGNDVAEAEVWLDGAQIAKSLDGKPIPVNPGPHALKFVVPNHAPIEQQLVVRVGERNRMITAEIGAETSGETDTPPVNDPGGGVSGKRVAAYALGGVGLVSLGVFAYLGLTGKSELAALQDGCGKTHSCATEDVDAVKGELIGADVALGVGIASVGVATVLFLTSGAKKKGAESARVQPLVAPLPGGGAAMVVGTF